jgi:hypothetical protein
MRFMILVLLVLTFSPFDIENDFFYLIEIDEEAYSESEIPGMIGKYRSDSKHHCSCLFCIATAGSIYTPVIGHPKEAEKLDPISLVSTGCPSYFKVFRPPRA